MFMIQKKENILSSDIENSDFISVIENIRQYYTNELNDFLLKTCEKDILVFKNDRDYGFRERGGGDRGQYINRQLPGKEIESDIKLGVYSLESRYKGSAWISVLSSYILSVSPSDSSFPLGSTDIYSKWLVGQIDSSLKETCISIGHMTEPSGRINQLNTETLIMSTDRLVPPEEISSTDSEILLDRLLSDLQFEYGIKVKSASKRSVKSYSGQGERMPYLPSFNLTMRLMQILCSTHLQLLDATIILSLLDTWAQLFTPITKNLRSKLHPKAISHSYATSHGFSNQKEVREYVCMQIYSHITCICRDLHLIINANIYVYFYLCIKHI